MYGLAKALGTQRRFSRRVYQRNLQAEATELEAAIRQELRALVGPVEADQKSHSRQIHAFARSIAMERHRSWLEKQWPKYSHVFAEPQEIRPERVRPRLHLVQAQGDRDVFRLARLTWSLPYSGGYGRRLHYLVYDDSNSKLIGILGLQSPPICLPARDRKFNIPYDKKPELVNQTMDAYTMGAVPPYNDLLGGKLVVLAAASRDVRLDYERRYGGRETQILKRVLPGSLIAITTLSAFGPSSVYNRVSTRMVRGRNVWATESLGSCVGWGTVQLSDDLYEKMKAFHRLLMPDRALHGFGIGPKIRQQVTKRVMRDLGYSDEFLRHNIQREVLIIPHVANLDRVLGGEDVAPRFNDRAFNVLARFWHRRYCLPRSQQRCPIAGRTNVARSLGIEI